MENSAPDGGMLAGIRMVPMTTAHLDAVVKIEQEVYTDPWTATSFVEVMSMSADNWVALSGGEVVGYLVTQWILDEIHIMNVAVALRMHRRGVGRFLIQHVMSEGIRRSMRDMFLEVRVGNTGAIALYEHFGFTPLTTRKKYYADGEDALVMHRAIPDQEPGGNDTSMDTAGSKTEEK